MRTSLNPNFGNLYSLKRRISGDLNHQHQHYWLRDRFSGKTQCKNILIPGFGYGRNAQVFRANGMAVTGIEISGSAIEIARKHYGNNMTIYQGSVTDMPFDELKIRWHILLCPDTFTQQR